jgi:Tol biopolymer transport system component
MWRYGWIVVFLVAGLMACTASPPASVVTGTPTVAAVAAATIAVTRVVQPTATLSPTPEATFRPTVAPTITSPPTNTVLPSPTPSPWLIQDRGNLLFYSVWWRHRETQIYVLPIGGNSRFVAYGDLLEGRPLSFDGTRLVYDPHRSPPIGSSSGQLAIANLETGETMTIYLRGRPQAVFWSPDGKFLLYLTYGQVLTGDTPFYQARIGLYDFETRQTQLLTETSNILTLAGWSPDGQKVAFVSDMNGQFDLYSLDINDLTLRQLTHSSAIESVAFWSPIDNLLLFGTWFHDLETLLGQSEPLDSAGDLYLIDDLGENIQLLGDSAYGTISWSPDGRKLAYSNNFDAICVLDIESHTEVCPANTSPLTLYYNFMPTWSADSEWLAFRATLREEVQCFTVFILELDTNHVTEVDTDECGNPSPAIWVYNLP